MMRDDPLLGMPEWFEGLRPHQEQAIDEAVDAFEHGARMVLIDAPTGSGKTVIGEVVRRRLRARGLYVCHGLELQDQFVRDFDAPVLKGRSNYPTVRGGWEVTADNCMGRMCGWCPGGKATCAYEQAKDAAIRGNPAVLNTAYYLTEANGPGRMRGRELVVLDEADTIEGEILRWAEFRVGRRAMGDVGIRPPKKGVHWPTMMDWLYRYAMAATRRAGQVENDDPAEARRLRARAEQVYRLFPAGEDGENWVREYPDSGAVLMRPIRVDGLGREYLWRHGSKHLLMSATLIGPEFMLRDIGWDEDYHVVSVPMTFPVGNREIIAVPVATMTRAGQEAGEWDRMVDGVERVMAKHAGERVLVHTVSYELARYLSDRLGGLAYTKETRAQVLAEYKRVPGSVLFAPSMDRGVDLPGDLCRVQVVAKMPYPYLGDKRVNARMHGPGGQVWYNLQTVRALVQMTGRGVRSVDDWATTYILDRQFVSRWNDYRHLVPGWWKEAVVTDRRPSQVLPVVG